MPMNDKLKILKRYKVDTHLLKRDYIKHPLYRKDGFHLSEHPIKEDFIYLFLTCNMRRSDLCIFFGVADGTIDNFIKKFNCQKSKKQSNVNSRNTIFEKYGCDNIFKVAFIKEKQLKTVYEKYKVTNVSKLECIKLKKINTTKINKTIVTSKEENIIYLKLCKKFDCVKRQYYSEKYPFACDFYIPEKDLYIEYQGTWSHGKMPYDETNEKCKTILDYWKNCLNDRIKKGINNSRYIDAINVWTIRDPLKRKIAKENNLNWIEFFTMDEFLSWYNNLK